MSVSADLQPVPCAGPLELAELIVRTARGDGAAFSEVYEQTWRQTYAIAVRVLRCPDHAAEVTQDVYATVWTQADRFDPSRGTVGAWLATMTRRRAIDRARRITSQVSRDDRWARETPESLHDQVWDRVAQHLDGRGLEQALADLPGAKREVITLAYVGGLTQAEIATRLGVPLGTVKSRLRDGLRALRVVLERGCGEPNVSIFN